MIKIPYAFLPPAILEKLHYNFMPAGKIIEGIMFPNIGLRLQQARIPITGTKYITMCFVNNLFVSGIIFFITLLFLAKSSIPQSHVGISFFAAVFIMLFFLMQQRFLPEIIIKKRVNNLERNILPALQNILVQLRSGIPLFDVMVNVASSDYGDVSKEFLTVVKQINGGIHQIDALEKVALENPSPLFRGALWQMVNGMKTGANLSDVLRDIMNNLAEEQLLQVEEYGATLSPLTMFYMIGAVILPAIGINFLIVIVAFMQLDQATTQMVFYGVFGFTTFMQLMFINIIKSKRPSLLKDD